MHWAARSHVDGGGRKDYMILWHGGIFVYNCGFPQSQDLPATHLSIRIPIIEGLQPTVYYRESLKTFPKYNWKANSWCKGTFSKVFVSVVCSWWARVFFHFPNFYFICYLRVSYMYVVYFDHIHSPFLSLIPSHGFLNVGTDIHGASGFPSEC